MTDEELVAAIDRAYALIHETCTHEEIYKTLVSHLSRLLEEQQRRAIEGLK